MQRRDVGRDQRRHAARAVGALGAFGASDVIAPLTPVNDEHVLAVMRQVHSRLAAGDTPAVALAAATALDGELDPVAAAFVVIGA